MEIPKKKKKKFQRIASNHSSDTESGEFMKPFKNYTKKPFSYSLNNTTLS